MTTITASDQERLAPPKVRWLHAITFDEIRVVLGLLLLTAAALKGWQLATEPTAEKGLLTSRWSLIVGVEAEFLLALWLLSGLYRQAAWRAALGCFGIFTCITLYKAMSGEGSCGCFGRVQINPWYTLVIDLGAIGLLLGSARWKVRRASAGSSRYRPVVTTAVRRDDVRRLEHGCDRRSRDGQLP